MKLQYIIEKYPIISSYGNLNIEINSMTIDSRKATKNSMFFAISGTQVNGYLFIDSAIQNGSTAIICEQIPEKTHPKVTYIQVKNVANACGNLSHTFFGKPSHKLQLIGITGTNGKTTCATLLYQICLKLGKKTALLSTINNKINETELPSTHTTPNAIAINQLLANAVNKGCKIACMEVSSHSLHQERIAGLQFFIAGFTNLTHDHLDYHKTFEEYRDTKKLFFDALSSQSTAIINIDDKNGNYLIQNSKAIIKTYSLQSVADYKAKVVESSINGMLLNFNNTEFWLPLAGIFNAYNALWVYAAACQLGFKNHNILTALSTVSNVKGRFETFITPSHINIVIDYAHTPDALENVLQNLNKIKEDNQAIITVFGCGGDRDKDKRPLMGHISCQYSNHVIITSDNPRTEDPQEIINDIEKGINSKDVAKTIAITNRKQAIKQALIMAQKNDIILIAGKGHEDYQEINNIKHPFDDLLITKQLTKQLKK